MSINITIGEKEYFPNIKQIKYEGKQSKDPLSFKYYDAEKDDYVMVNDITNEQAQDIRNVLNKFRTILKYQYGTGWEVFISKNADGVVSINKDYYDPGY